MRLRHCIYGLVMLVLVSCQEDPVQSGDPFVAIINPVMNSAVFDSVTVKVEAGSQRKIVRVEIFIDYKAVVVFTKPPYEYLWFTS